MVDANFVNIVDANIFQSEPPPLNPPPPLRRAPLHAPYHRFPVRPRHVIRPRLRVEQLRAGLGLLGLHPRPVLLIRRVLRAARDVLHGPVRVVAVRGGELGGGAQLGVQVVPGVGLPGVFPGDEGRGPGEGFVGAVAKLKGELVRGGGEGGEGGGGEAVVTDGRAGVAEVGLGDGGGEQPGVGGGALVEGGGGDGEGGGVVGERGWGEGSYRSGRGFVGKR